ncbi:MAG: TlpA family protein disulfide reductase [Candidatus Aminicenantes bacterium]|nr:TlpA family protein disulfide reductase [Candidatus Aminicenantes bacterium]
MKKIISILFIIILFIFVLSSCKTVDDQGNNTIPDSSEIGQYIGDFIQAFVELDQDGNTFSLDSYKGKVILLNISAMWCGPCRSEASELMEIYNTFKERGLEIVQCIYQDEEGKASDQSDIQRWVKEFFLSFIVLTDPDSSLTDFFNFNGVPFNVIIGRDFVIRYRKAGFDKTSVIAKIEELL